MAVGRVVACRVGMRCGASVPETTLSAVYIRFIAMTVSGEIARLLFLGLAPAADFFPSANRVGVEEASPLDY